MRTTTITSVFCLMLAPSAHAQLLENINELPQPTSALPVDSFPNDFVVAGNRVYFSATTGPTGREYFWLDGSGAPAQLLADIAPGSADSNPRDLVRLPNGLLLFTAENAALGREVWVSDGTAAGTSVLVDLSGPGEYTQPKALVVHQGNGYFLASPSGSFSMALWRTDGTAAGTVQLDDLGLVGSYSSAGQMLVSTGTELFYTASESVYSGGVLSGLWRLYTSDGTVGGAQLLTQVAEDSWYGPRELTAVGTRVVFSARGSGTGPEPWVSDGTALGTAIVDLIPGASGSGPSEFTVVGSNVFFAAYENGIDGEIFVSDGTVAGTVQLTSSSAPFTRPLFLSAVGSQLAYCANDGVHGNELWVTGSTPGSDVMFAEFVPGILGGDPDDMVKAGNGILCRARTPATGEELFFSDGTPGGTFVVKDIVPGPDSSMPQGMTVFGVQVLFGAEDPVLGNEPWVSDLTAAGTRVHTDLAATGLDQSSYPQGFANLGDRAVFSADDGVSGKELWASDGTAAGTVRLTDFNGIEPSFSVGPTRIVAFDGRALVALDDGVHGTEPWITDGTVQGTHLLLDLVPGAGGSYCYPMRGWRNELYFGAGQSQYYKSLYATDGTAAGTRLVAGFVGFGNSLLEANLVEHAGRLYFAARTTAAGTELWSTDGTAAGTAMVADVNPGTMSSMGQLYAASVGGYLYFSASDASGDVELWRTDGTAAGTGLFMDLNPAFSSSPYDLHWFGQRLVFSANVNGDRHYYGTDGTTVEQLSFAPLFLNSNWTLYSNGERLIGMLRGPGASFELWGTDGTAAGSGVIKQIHPDGTEFVNLRAWRVSSGPKLVFLAGDSTVGSELFVTDGTSAGTGVLFDLTPGPGDSDPSDVIRLGDQLLFDAYAPQTGWELYSLPWTLVDDWLAEPFGRGCAGGNGQTPQLTRSGTAQPGGTLDVEIEGAAPLAPVLTYWSSDYGLLDLGPCSVYLATPTFGAGGVTDAFGASSLPIGVPNLPSLVGVGLWLQSLVVDVGGGLFGLGGLTPALEIRVGG